MDLSILVSKKGTKVVLATDLHRALQLADHHYPTNVRRWLNDFYEFNDGIRKPIKLQEFASRPLPETALWQDYYLSITLAKQIVLRSTSKLKQRIANQLAVACEEEAAHGLSTPQFQHLLQVTRAMMLVSCQEECERRHLRRYKERNAGSAANWWKYRAEVLGYSSADLREKLRRKNGIAPTSKNQRTLLTELDPYELIRAGVIDLFMAIGKSADYARQMGDLAKQLATGMQLELIDDHRKVDLFTEAIDPEWVHALKKPVAEHLAAA
jgi:hypothetical protein